MSNPNHTTTPQVTLRLKVGDRSVTEILVDGFRAGKIVDKNGRHLFNLKQRYRFQPVIAAHCLVKCQELDHQHGR